MAEVLTNRPTFPSPEVLKDILTEENADLCARRDELLAAAERVPAEVKDDETAGKVGDFLKQLDACIKMAERRRVDTKEPALAAAKSIDGFYAPVKDAIQRVRATIAGRLQTYLTAKADAERRRREKAEADALAEAKRKEQEALKSIGTASQTVADTKIDEASRAAERADAATEAAQAKPAEMARTRGDLGTVATLRVDWTGELTDRKTLDLEALREHLSADALEKAIRSYVKAGGRELRGARIFERQTALVR